MMHIGFHKKQKETKIRREQKTEIKNKKKQRKIISELLLNEY